jgi:hypothetical protein
MVLTSRQRTQGGLGTDPQRQGQKKRARESSHENTKYVGLAVLEWWSFGVMDKSEDEKIETPRREFTPVEQRIPKGSFNTPILHYSNTPFFRGFNP